MSAHLNDMQKSMAEPLAAANYRNVAACTELYDIALSSCALEGFDPRGAIKRRRPKPPPFPTVVPTLRRFSIDPSKADELWALIDRPVPNDRQMMGALETICQRHRDASIQDLARPQREADDETRRRIAACTPKLAVGLEKLAPERRTMLNDAACAAPSHYTDRDRAVPRIVSVLHRLDASLAASPLTVQEGRLLPLIAKLLDLHRRDQNSLGYVPLWFRWDLPQPMIRTTMSGWSSDRSTSLRLGRRTPSSASPTSRAPPLVIRALSS